MIFFLPTHVKNISWDNFHLRVATLCWKLFIALTWKFSKRDYLDGCFQSPECLPGHNYSIHPLVFDTQLSASCRWVPRNIFDVKCQPQLVFNSRLKLNWREAVERHVTWSQLFFLFFFAFLFFFVIKRSKSVSQLQYESITKYGKMFPE